MNEPIRWEDLQNWQRIALTNGCGGKGFPIPVPKFRFTASCDRHDFGYWRGGTASDRKAVDRGFLRAMLVDANRGTWWRKVWYRAWARTYYTAVRCFGGRFFHYREAPATRADLDSLLHLYERPDFTP